MRELWSDLVKVHEKVLKEAIQGFTTKTQELLPKMPNKASGDQFRAMLKNNGVTPDEIKYLKLDQVLNKDRVTKDEIVAHLDRYGVPVHATDHVETNGPKYREYALKGGKNYGEKLVKLSDQKGEVKPITLKWVEAKGTEKYHDVVRQWNGYYEHDDISGKYNPIPNAVAEIYTEQPDGSEQEYIVARVKDPGDDNYGVSAHWADVLNEPFDNERQLNDALERAKKACALQLREIEIRGEKDGGSYYSNHWPGHKNPIFHVRHQEFEDADGKSLWLIEEIQSDLHQSARKKGYKGSFKAEIRHVPAENESHPYHVYIGGEKVSGHKDEAGAKASAAEIEPRWNENNGVMDAPMKKSWEENAFKYALKQAIDAGADRIGWVTGDISASRYDLSKKIGSVMYNEKKGQTLRAFKPADKAVAHIEGTNGGLAFEKVGVQPEEIESILGKELAERLMKQPEDKDGRRWLKGLDLKVGGEGMKAAYDQRIPSIAKKIAKQGGSQVGKVAIPSASDKKDNHDPDDMFDQPEFQVIEDDDEKGEPAFFVIKNTTGQLDDEKVAGPFYDEDEANQKAAELHDKAEAKKQKEAPIQVWYMDITDGIKEMAKKGFRLALESVAQPDWFVVKDAT